MAIYAPGAAIGSISGNVGGISFSNPSGSKVVRKPRRSSPVRSTGAVNQQNALGIVASAWNNFSLDDQNRWRTFAANRTTPNRIGIARSLSGWQEFARGALRAIKLNLPIIEEPPFSQTPNPVISVTFTASVATGIECNFTAPGAGVQVSAWIYAMPLYRTTIPKFNRDWTFIIRASGVNPSTFFLTSAYEAVFPSPVLGQTIAFRFAPHPLETFNPTSITDHLITTTA